MAALHHRQALPAIPENKAVVASGALDRPGEREARALLAFALDSGGAGADFLSGGERWKPPAADAESDGEADANAASAVSGDGDKQSRGAVAYLLSLVKLARGRGPGFGNDSPPRTAVLDEVARTCDDGVNDGVGSSGNGEDSPPLTTLRSTLASLLAADGAPDVAALTELLGGIDGAPVVEGVAAKDPQDASGNGLSESVAVDIPADCGGAPHAGDYGSCLSRRCRGQVGLGRRCLEYAFFIANNAVVLGIVACATMLTEHLVSNNAAWIAVLAVGGGAWALLLVANIALACRPASVLKSYLKSGKAACPGDFLPEGHSVVLQGTVCLPKAGKPLFATATDKGLVVLERRAAPQGRGVSEMLLHQAAVDFCLDDEVTGQQVTVLASAASMAGRLATYLQSEVAVSGALKAGTLEEVVHEKSLRVGQVVRVLGTVNVDVGSNSELVLAAGEAPQRLPRLLFAWRVVPFFWPLWVDALVVADNS